MAMDRSTLIAALCAAAGCRASQRNVSLLSEIREASRAPGEGRHNVERSGDDNICLIIANDCEAKELSGQLPSRPGSDLLGDSFLGRIRWNFFVLCSK